MGTAGVLARIFYKSLDKPYDKKLMNHVQTQLLTAQVMDENGHILYVSESRDAHYGLVAVGRGVVFVAHHGLGVGAVFAAGGHVMRDGAVGVAHLSEHRRPVAGCVEC